MEGRKRPILAYQQLSAEAIGWPRFNFTSLNRAVLRSPTSALKRIADSSQTLRHVRNVPMPEVAPYCSINSPAIAGSFDCIDGAVFTSAASIHPCHT
jgi:hypothetical protein